MAHTAKKMGSVMGIDRTKLQQLDEMLLELDQSSSAAPAEMADLVSNASSAVRILRNSLKSNFSNHVAQLARDGKQKEAGHDLIRLFPGVQIGDVVDVLRLIYVDEKDLPLGVGFVEMLDEEFQGRRTRRCTRTSATRGTLRCLKFCCCRET